MKRLNLWKRLKNKLKRIVKEHKKHPIFSNSLMAHALGGYDGRVHLNCREGFEQSIKNGFRYFEVDMELTSDDRLIVCHGWTKADCEYFGFNEKRNVCDMTYDEIRKLDLYGHQIMDAREFYKLVKKHKKLHFEVDIRHVEGEALEKRIYALLEDFEHDKKCLDRLLIQVFTKKMWSTVDHIYHFKYYQYMIGKNMKKLDKGISFCKKNNICALALRYNLAKPEDVKKIKDAGLHILCYTIADDVWAAQKLLASGVDTICTDYITPKMLRKNKFKPYNPYYIYYNSGLKNAEQAYTYEIEKKIQLRGEVKQSDNSGNLEFMDADVWETGGKLN